MKNSSFSNGFDCKAIKVPFTIRTMITLDHMLLLTEKKRSCMHMLLITAMLVIILIVLDIAMYVCKYACIRAAYV